MNTTFPNLDPLLNPGAIAVVGASERQGSAGRLVLENLRQLDYSGQVYAVHPKHRQVLGFPCYPDLKSLPGPVDSVALLLGADKVLPSLEIAVAIDVKAAWVLASGYSESGTEGRVRQAELVSFAREHGLMLCGPNCIGMVNPVDRVATYSVALSSATRPGCVSAVMQSGAIALGLANVARFGFRYLVSSGNEAVLDSADYIAHFVQDPDTRIIVAFLEGIRNPAKFIAAVHSAAAAGKPILLIKVGRSEAAQTAVQAHTGSLAGSDAVFDAVCRRLGVVRLETLDELVESVELFRTCPLPAGEGIGLLSLSGGQIGLAADLAQDLQLAFPTFSDTTVQALGTILPDYCSIANPLDAWGSGDLENTYPGCVKIVSREENIHLLAVSRDTPPEVARREVEQSLSVAEAALLATEETGKPVVLFSNFSCGFQPEVKTRLEEGNVPYLQGTCETLRAIQAFVRYGWFQSGFKAANSERRKRPVTVDLAAWRKRLDNLDRALCEVEGRELLAAYGIRGPRETVSSTAGDAVAAAQDIGFPVVLKILSPDIQHKTEIGGVCVGLDSADAVEEAFVRVIRAAGTHHPKAWVDGVLIQEMIPAHAVEVILGVIRDPEFGPVVVFGSGGILVELVKDSIVELPPLDRAQAHAMIQQTRGARLLRGFRGRPPADVEALADALVRLSWLATDLGDLIVALDINPLMVLPEGHGVRAVDALVELRA